MSPRVQGEAGLAALGPVLALDASSRRPCVALVGPGGEPWGVWNQPEGERGTARLAPAIAELLRARDLAARDLMGVAAGTGPGSYTGLRAAIALARGLGLGAGLPVVGVVSVEAAARAVLREHPEVGRVVVVLDARRGQVYRADYARPEGRGPEAEADEAQVDPVVLEPPRLVSVEDLAAEEAVCPPGWMVVREPLPEGYDVAALGRRRLRHVGDESTAVRPLYLKRSHAEINLEERSKPS